MPPPEIGSVDPPPPPSRILFEPIYIWGCTYSYQDNVTNFVPGLICDSYMTNLTKVTKQRLFVKVSRF